MARLVDPILADLQPEHHEAVTQGSVWRRRLAWLRAIVALMRAGAVHSLYERPCEERRQVSRAFVVTAAAFVVVGAILCAPLPLYLNWPWSRLVYFAPYVVPVALPASLVCGMVFGLGHIRHRLRVWSLTLALVASCGLCWFMTVVVPASSQALQDRFQSEPTRSRLVQETLGTVPGPVAVAIMRMHPGPIRVFRPESRLALACAPLVLVVLLLSIGCGRQWLDAAIGMAIVLGYFGSLRWVDLVYQAPVAKAWVPNLICLVLATGLILLRLERTKHGKPA